MRTQGLIDALAADAGTPPARLGSAVAAAALVGLAGAIAAFALLLGPRPDIAAALGGVRFPFKFLVTGALALAAAAFALRLCRPGADARLAAAALAAAPALLALGVAAELATLPGELWTKRLVGSNALVCVTFVPVLSAIPLAAALAALRRGAPASPAAAGAAAGLLAGAIGATVYGAHCADDSPLFVAAWYPLGIGLVALAGAAAGGRALRW